MTPSTLGSVRSDERAPLGRSRHTQTSCASKAVLKRRRIHCTCGLILLVVDVTVSSPVILHVCSGRDCVVLKGLAVNTAIDSRERERETAKKVKP